MSADWVRLCMVGKQLRERLMPKPLEETVRKRSQIRSRPLLASQLWWSVIDAAQPLPIIAIQEHVL